jgi:hypothetical protein
MAAPTSASQGGVLLMAAFPSIHHNNHGSHGIHPVIADTTSLHRAASYLRSLNAAVAAAISHCS